MKIRTNICAGGKGCSPETLAYMEKALNAQTKLEHCLANRGVKNPDPYYGYPYPTGTQPSYVGNTYPDMSGYCG